MKQVKIIFGAYGYKPAGAAHVRAVPVGGVVEVADDEAARLVSIGTAAYITEEYPTQAVITPPVDEEQAGAGGNTEEDENTPEGEENDTDAPEYSVSMKADQLRALLEKCGIPFKFGMTKADMVAVLDQHFSAGEYADEEPPDLGAGAPVV